MGSLRAWRKSCLNTSSWKVAMSPLSWLTKATLARITLSWLSDNFCRGTVTEAATRRFGGVISNEKFDRLVINIEALER